MVCGMSHWLACVVVCTSILTILEIYLFCELVEIAFELGCSSLRCVDIGVTLGFVCQFLAVLIISELFQFRQLTYDIGSYLYSSCTSYAWMNRVIQRFVKD